VGPLSQDLRVFQYSSNFISQDLLPLMLFWNARNHSIIDLVVLDDLVHGGTSDAHLFCNVSDGHSHRLKYAISSKPKFNDFNFHCKINTRPLLQELLQILDWQIDNFGILLKQDVIESVTSHFTMVFSPALQFGRLFLILLMRCAHGYHFRC